MRSLISLPVVVLISSSVNGLIIGSKCICLPAENACSQQNRCNLNTTIFPSNSSVPKTPAWVVPAISSLVSNTLARAKNGTISQAPLLGNEYSQPSTPYGTQFQAGMTCANETHGVMWATSCGERSISYKEFMTGYAMLGAHPLGTEPGTWLTQIIMPVADTPLDPWGYPYTGGFVASCIAADAYINIDKINDDQPLDIWKQKVSGYPWVAPTTAVGWRTDNDLRKNGLNTDCGHFDCPAIGHKTEHQISMESDPRSWNLTCKTKTSDANFAHSKAGVVPYLALGLFLL
ncbi:hypothetical protein K458DRAFT_461368 [Lentithecium fluviatile CBS 122367]|uniref:Lytic polysaccharide monooxygenase n=1 Tax=Lentithecium fluviatile CBS 122367 TaxID=1168545 RepID=A0A6G1IM53_9PLEO|nr:hypothetical protein K458DRAFT_461368 [Lentithecium fluviatile CBS 122367]